jgi:hypothetical protein
MGWGENFKKPIPPHPTRLPNGLPRTQLHDIVIVYLGVYLYICVLSFCSSLSASSYIAYFLVFKERSYIHAILSSET